MQAAAAVRYAQIFTLDKPVALENATAIYESYSICKNRAEEKNPLPKILLNFKVCFASKLVTWFTKECKQYSRGIHFRQHFSFLRNGRSTMKIVVGYKSLALSPAKPFKAGV